MFETVKMKLERAEYCLENLRKLPLGEQSSWRTNLDCFFFEIISAKDFFLQEINDRYRIGLKKDDATCIPKLKQRCSNKVALEVVESIEKKLSNTSSWLWKLNNYRNSAMHRELLHIAYDTGINLSKLEVRLFEDPEDRSKGNMSLEVIPYCEQSLKEMQNFLDELYEKL